VYVYVDVSPFKLAGPNHVFSLTRITDQRQETKIVNSLSNFALRHAFSSVSLGRCGLAMTRNWQLEAAETQCAGILQNQSNGSHLLMASKYCG